MTWLLKVIFHKSLLKLNKRSILSLNKIGKQDKVVLVGHSAGAHLGALCLNHPLLSKATLLSGIYDLLPIQETYLNHALNLSQEDILKYSPIHQQEQINIPCTILCGGWLCCTNLSLKAYSTI